MKKLVICTLAVSFLVILSSCWDQRYLKDHALILAIGYDLNDDHTISKTVSFPKETPSNTPESSGQSGGQNATITTKGNTIGDTDIELDRFLSQKFDRSKARILLIGEKLAEYGIFPTLDALYRDPRGPLNASVIVVSGKAEDGLKIEKKQSFFTSEFYFDLIKTAEDSGLTKSENVQSICPIIIAKRRDIVIPYIQMNEEKSKAELFGFALFSGDKMTGKIGRDDSIMLLLLMDGVAKDLKLNLQLSDDKERREKNFVTIGVKKEKRKLKIEQDRNSVKVKININVRVQIEEFPETETITLERSYELQGIIREKLDELAKNTIKKIQEVNNDSIGIGERIQSFHPSIWKQLDWKETYPDVPIEVKFNVEVVQHGIIN